MIIVPFTVTAANLNLSDTADQTILSLASNDMIIRAPVRLELRKEAGTAYALAPIGPEEHANSRFKTRLRPDFPSGSYSDMFSGEQYLVVSDDLGRSFFFVPMVGFLDQ